MSMFISNLVSYFWGIRDYSLNKNSSRESLYSYINNDSYRVANHKFGDRDRVASAKCVDGAARVAHMHSPAYYRRGSPAFRRKGRLKRQG